MSGIPTEGSPLGTSPTTATPWSERPSAQLSAMPSTSAIRPPGRRGASRSAPNSSTRASTPTVRVAPLVSPSSPSRLTNCSIVSSPLFSTPKILGSWLTVTKIASPKTNPSITGRDRNWAMKPSRRSPAARNRAPQKSTRPAARVAYSSAPDGLRSATPEATRIAAAEVPATTTCRLVPKIAYAARVTSRV